MVIKVEKQRKKGWIYLYRNKINGKGYVGQTHNLRWRKNAHRCGVQSGYKKHFYNVVRRQGWDIFEFKILCWGELTKKQLDTLEIYFIKELDTLVPNGYNVALGGGRGSGFKQTSEHIEKRARANRGKKRSIECKLKLKRSWVLKKQDPNYVPNRKGVKLTKEIKYKMSLWPRSKKTPEELVLMSQRQLGRKYSKEINEKRSRDTNEWFLEKWKKEDPMRYLMKKKGYSMKRVMHNCIWNREWIRAEKAGIPKPYSVEWFFLDPKDRLPG